MLDLYLLELDPGYAYPQRFSRKTNGNIVRLGDVTYSVVSVNNTSFTLKIIGAMGTDRPTSCRNHGERFCHLTGAISI